MNDAFTQLHKATAAAINNSLKPAGPSQTAPLVSGDKDDIIADLQKQLLEAKSLNKQLEDSIKVRVSSFIHRETSARKIVEELESRLDKSLESDDDYKAKMLALRDLHSGVTTALNGLQQSTKQTLESQEKELMRGFRLRFEEVSKDLDALKSKSGDYNATMQAKLRKLSTELQAAQELSQTLEKKNTSLLAKNKQLLDSINAQQDDRQTLMKQLVTLKHKKGHDPDLQLIEENERLKTEIKLIQNKQSHVYTFIGKALDDLTNQPGYRDSADDRAQIISLLKKEVENVAIKP